MDVSKRLERNALVPVVVLDRSADAVPTAKALLAGGIDVMEITLRTAAALESIALVAAQCPEMLVGAGTVLDVEQAKAAVEAGAKFIVSPGFDAEMVAWCLHQGVNVVPGCVTPSEIMAARKLGLNILKFFPANVYGGLAAMKNLAAPFTQVRFVPTGGVNGQNIGEYTAASYIYTVGGSWVCAKADIAAGNFEKITGLCASAVKAALGFTVCAPALTEAAVALFGADAALEETAAEDVLTVKTNHVGRGLAYLEKKGCTADPATAQYKGERMVSVCVTGCGCKVRLLQK